MSTILMRTDLDDDPRIQHIAGELKVNPCYVAGALWKLWSLAFTQTHNGRFQFMTTTSFDGMVGLPGFCTALESVGWLAVRGGKVVIPRFDKYFGLSAKTRAQSRLRKSRQRWNKPDNSIPDGTHVTLERDGGSQNEGHERDTCATPERIGLEPSQPERSGAEPSQPDRNANAPPAAVGGAGVAAAPRVAGGGMAAMFAAQGKRGRLVALGIHEGTLDEFLRDARVTDALIAKVSRQQTKQGKNLRSPGAWAAEAIREELRRAS